MATTASGTVTLGQVTSVFPVGTFVSVYSRGAMQPKADRTPLGPPSGTAMATIRVNAAGTLTFGGLPDCRWLTAYALVNGEHRYLGFSTWPRRG